MRPNRKELISTIHELKEDYQLVIRLNREDMLYIERALKILVIGLIVSVGLNLVQLLI